MGKYIFDMEKTRLDDFAEEDFNPNEWNFCVLVFKPNGDNIELVHSTFCQIADKEETSEDDLIAELRKEIEVDPEFNLVGEKDLIYISVDPMDAVSILKGSDLPERVFTKVKEQWTTFYDA